MTPQNDMNAKNGDAEIDQNQDQNEMIAPFFRVPNVQYTRPPGS
jgi:hypothetical protein